MKRHLFASSVVALCLAGTSVEAKQARCFSTDDGKYECSFVATGPDGSFEISAPAKPTFRLVMEEPGVAFGFADFGNGNVSLPGRYLRSDSDPACWVNDATSAELCAW